jgi:hypothetical protein
MNRSLSFRKSSARSVRFWRVDRQAISLLLVCVFTSGAVVAFGAFLPAFISFFVAASIGPMAWLLVHGGVQDAAHRRHGRGSLARGAGKRFPPAAQPVPHQRLRASIAHLIESGDEAVA